MNNLGVYFRTCPDFFKKIILSPGLKKFVQNRFCFLRDLNLQPLNPQLAVLPLSYGSFPS